jgi:hypothetical protein
MAYAGFVTLNVKRQDKDLEVESTFTEKKGLGGDLKFSSEMTAGPCLERPPFDGFESLVTNQPPPPQERCGDPESYDSVRCARTTAAVLVPVASFYELPMSSNSFGRPA